MPWILRRILARSGTSGTAWVLGVAMVLCLASLGAPLMVDDLSQARKLNPEFWGPPLPLGGADFDGTFDFISAAASGVEGAVQEGYLGWWASPDLQLRFWRPLASLTHLLDHQLWPDHLVLMRLHSLAWQLALCVLVGVVLRRFLSPREALLALALYCWDDARGMTLGFLANRNALLAGVFGLLCLLAHRHWRQTGAHRFAAASVLCLGVGLLSAELALSTTAWLFAYALCLDRGSWSSRLRSLVPAALVVVAWAAAYRHLGYGATGSGVYVHPLHDPLLYLQRLRVRLPWYLLGQLSPVPSDIQTIVPPVLERVGAAVGAGLGLGLLGLVWGALRKRPELRFFAVGGALSLLPIGGVFCSDRNLTFVSLGAAALLAVWLVDWLDRPREGWSRVLFGAIVGAHLGLAGLVLPLRCLSPLAAEPLFMRLYAPVADLPELEERTAVYVWLSTEMWPGFGRLEAVARDRPVPRRAVSLVVSEGPLTVHRLDERRLRLEVEGFLARESQQMARRPEPFEVGHRVSLPDVQITVEEVDASGRPTVILAAFEASVDDPRFLWQVERFLEFPRWRPPRVGESVTVGGLP